jgi:hypothetical protein
LVGGQVEVDVVVGPADSIGAGAEPVVQPAGAFVVRGRMRWPGWSEAMILSFSPLIHTQNSDESFHITRAEGGQGCNRCIVGEPVEEDRRANAPEDGLRLSLLYPFVTALVELPLQEIGG